MPRPRNRATARLIGIVTSGGDAPGMNAVIHGSCEAAQERGRLLVGFRLGLYGLVQDDQAAVDPAVAVAASSAAGTWLQTSRSQALIGEEGTRRALAAATRSAPAGLIVVGGNGSLKAAQLLTSHGLTVAFVPATIDNDVPGTEVTIGFDSAIAYALDVIDRLRVTARAMPGRAFLVETLGGGNGTLARAVASAAGLKLVITPEEPIHPRDVAKALADNGGPEDAIAILCEGAGDAVRLGETIHELSGIRIRPTILGHAQRAATPSETDRSLGRLAGATAVAELIAGRSSFIELRANGSVEAVALNPTAARVALAPAPRAKEHTG